MYQTTETFGQPNPPQGVRPIVEPTHPTHGPISNEELKRTLGDEFEPIDVNASRGDVPPTVWHCLEGSS